MSESTSRPEPASPQDPAFNNYRALLARLEAHWNGVEKAFPLTCARGCSACCYVDLSVSRVEADFIASHLGTAGEGEPSMRVPAGAQKGAKDHHSQFEMLAGPHPCVFLDEKGECGIYAARPSICRSHGIPVLVEGRRDHCPLNEGLDAAPALNLELFNTLLVAINARYCQERGGGKEAAAERISLRVLAGQVLAEQALAGQVLAEQVLTEKAPNQRRDTTSC